MMRPFRWREAFLQKTGFQCMMRERRGPPLASSIHPAHDAPEKCLEESMDVVEWKESFSVGNVLMDAHHRIFFETIREFNELPGKGDYEVVRKRIEFLIEYAAMHLGAEERLMRQANYPGLGEHKAVHDAFVHELESIKASFEENHDSVTAEKIMEIMQEWLVHHIAGSDKDYMPYVKGL